ncbi:glycosyltransferase [Nonlabens xiamenensis]|uniref:glycosyltransferase n=1 Tax=Nonlabens xiamenensis TaxID=2341043 RepID=UPI000F611D9E|nr:glycosyltransferase [Nonlabens xiamenensis]
MKILALSIPNHHFFQWINQLETSGHEVFWMDITDAGVSPKIPWVHQISGWRLKSDFPGRTRLKSALPAVYNIIQKFNERPVIGQLQKIIEQIQPDCIHCFEMKLTGVPFQKLWDNTQIPIIYSSWGSDLFDYQNLGLSRAQVKAFLYSVAYLITDCQRDYQIARQLGYPGKFLGVLPGNGGIDYPSEFIQPLSKRKHIIVKGYDDGVGQALHVVKAIEASDMLQNGKFEYVIYSADQNVIDYCNHSKTLQSMPIQIIRRGDFLENKALLKIMGTSLLHVAVSTSDGMPNSLLEAMGMGAFPIQSNPGGATQEVIENGVNGLIIENPMDVNEIRRAMESVIENHDVLQRAMEKNVAFMALQYERTTLRPVIQSLYQTLSNSS